MNVLYAVLKIAHDETPMTGKHSDGYSAKEGATRGEIVKRMIAMPPKPHSEMKLGKRKGKKAVSPKRAVRK